MARPESHEWQGIHRWFYRPATLACRFIRSQCLRVEVLNRERANLAGGFVLACTHVQHLEPFIVSYVMPRPVRWMARIEFYKFRIGAAMLRGVGTFPVNRQGVPVSSIRAGIRLAVEGKIVGIFPEGGCVRGTDLMFRGGRVKRGVCSIACRSQRPILPVVVLGTHTLTKIGPWLPARRGRVWVAFGEPIHPPAYDQRQDRRQAREVLAARVQAEFIETYRRLLDHSGLADSFTP
ncbi:MAG: lysophospholipid acyltransferase family protein [Tepidisphaeraceae bacterium]